MSLSRNLLAQRLEHDVAGGGDDEAEDFGGLHHLEQVAEIELQVAGDLVAVVAAAAIFEGFQQAEDPRQSGNPGSD